MDSKKVVTLQVQHYFPLHVWSSGWNNARKLYRQEVHWKYFKPPSFWYESSSHTTPMTQNVTRLILRDSSNIAFDLPPGTSKTKKLKQTLGQHCEQTWKEGRRLSVHTPNFLMQEYIINLIIGIGFSWTLTVTKICIC